VGPSALLATGAEADDGVAISFRPLEAAMRTSAYVASVASIELEPVEVVAASVTIASACRRLDEVGALVVLEPFGIVTAEDIVRAIARGADISARLTDLQLERPVIVPADSEIADVLRVLVEEPDRRVVVVDAAARIAGRVTLRSVLAGRLRPSAWVDGLRLALHLEEMNSLEVGR
jgi:predicted transcriptional regulator